MKKFLGTSFLCLVFIFSEAQMSTSITSYKFYNYKNIQKLGALSEKTLVIRDYSYSKSKLKKFKKKGVLEQKIKNLKEQNEKLLNLVKENWKYNTNIISSSTFEEEDEFIKNDKYLYFEVKNLTESRKKKTAGGGEITYYFSYSFLRLKGNKKMLSIYANSGGNFNDLEMISGLKFMQKSLSAAETKIEGKLFPDHVNENANTLKNKTLLIPSNATKLSVEKIEEKYGFPVKIVTFSEISEKISSKSSEYAYYLPQHQMGSCGKGFIHLIYSCENNEPIVLIEANKFQFGQHGGNAPLVFEIVPISGNIPMSKILRKKTFEKLNKIVAGI